MKKRNPAWGCPRIAEQIALAFGVSINKDVVRRILAAGYRPTPDSYGPSWLTFLGHAKDSLWSMDLFRCESMGITDVLGIGRDGSIYAAHHRIRHSRGSRRRARTLPNVQACHSKTADSELFELR